jgi:hypothetical protein
MQIKCSVSCTENGTAGRIPITKQQHTIKITCRPIPVGCEGYFKDRSSTGRVRGGGGKAREGKRVY